MFIKKVLPVAISIALVGCGGGSDVVTSTSKSLSGKVADGYLYGAIICIDVNENKICEDGEPQAKTTTGGNYTIEGVSDAVMAANHTIVVNVTTDTFDEGSQTFVSKKYTLSAPAAVAGQDSFVSPLTTMVQNQLEANPLMTVDAAESQLKQQLGIDDASVSLMDDFVAESEATGANANYEKLYAVAQVVARVMAENLAALESTADTVAAIDPDFNQTTFENEMMRIVVGEVVNSLSSVATLVDTALEAGTFKIDDHIDINGDLTGDAAVIVSAVDTAIDINDDNLVATLEAEAAIVKSSNSSVAVSFFELLQTTGLNWLSSDSNSDGRPTTPEYEVEKLSGTALTTSTFTFDPVTGAFDPDDNEWEITMTPNGWQLMQWGANVTLVDNGDGTSRFTSFAADDAAQAVALEDGTVRVAGTDVSGVAMSLFMERDNDSAWQFVNNPTFPAGSLAYSFSYTENITSYHIWADDLDCDGIDGRRLVGTEFICQTAWVDTTSGYVQPTSLSDLLTPAGTDLLSSSRIELGAGFGVVLMDDAAKTAHYYSAETINSQETITELASANWSDGTVKGEQLYSIEIPLNLVTMTWDGDYATRNTFFSVYDGYVRRGEKYVAGATEVDEEYAFNDVAMAALKTAYINNSLQPVQFSQQWLSGKTLFAVWFGEGVDQSGAPLPNDVAVVVQEAFAADGTVTFTGLRNHNSGEGTYLVTSAGELRYDGDTTSGNSVTLCNTSTDYIQTDYLASGVHDNTDRYFFDKSKAEQYAATLTSSIAPCPTPN